MISKSSNYINNWLVNHLKANSSGWLVSTLLIRRADIVERDDPWLLYFKEGAPVRTKTRSSLLTLLLQSKLFLSLLVPKSRERREEFWLSSQWWRERSKKEQRINGVWSEGKRGSRWAVWDKIKQKTLSTDVCVILDWRREIKRGRERRLS